MPEQNTINDPTVRALGIGAMIIVTLLTLAALGWSWFLLSVSHLLLFDGNAEVYAKLPSDEATRVISGAQSMVLETALPLAASNIIAVVVGWRSVFRRR